MDKPKRQLPKDFHALYDQGYRTSRGAYHITAPRPETTTILASKVPELVVGHDEATHLPNQITSRIPTARLSPPADSPEEAVTQFIKDQRELWKLSSKDIATVKVRSVSEKGLNTVRIFQVVEGKEVFCSDTTIAISLKNEVISFAGQLFPGTDVSRSVALAATRTSVEDAISKAAFDLTGIQYKDDDFSGSTTRTDDSGPYRFYDYKVGKNDPRPPFERPVRVKDVMFPLGEGVFIAAYFIELWIKNFPPFSYVIDAIDAPDVLFRKNLRSDATFTYRVHNTGDAVNRPEDGPAPGSPHPTGEPNGWQAPIIAEIDVTIESLMAGDPWLPADAEITSGNNCIAYADLSHPDGYSSGDVYGRVTSTRTFAHTYDHLQAASADVNVQNSVVGMFFHVNWLHDRWYEAGFDEAAGNAQADNLGRGGLGNDPILAEGNDYSGTDNANMSTPPDGSSPRMQMFEFLGPTPVNPSRTSNHEALITFHEMGHYITNRLVGDSSGLTNRQGRAMGEGWGDFFCISMTSQSTDNFSDGAFPIGGWTDLLPTFDDNYYYSIRRFPYSVDMTKNPLTFRHISAGVVLPADPPQNPAFGSGANNSVHRAGEIWCSALWEVFVNLVAKHGHAEGETRMLLYVVGGLEMTPNAPTYTQARDGIISAATTNHPEDLAEVWAGFAKRGLGIDAVSPPSNSLTLAGVVESYDMPSISTWAECTVNRVGPAENGIIYIHLRDNGGTFNHWFQAFPGKKNEMLATALEAMCKSATVNVYLEGTAAYSQINRLYISATDSESNQINGAISMLLLDRPEGTPYSDYLLTMV